MITRQQYEEMKFNLEEKQCQIDGQAFTIEAQEEVIQAKQKVIDKIQMYFNNYLGDKDRHILHYILKENL